MSSSINESDVHNSFILGNCWHYKSSIILLYIQQKALFSTIQLFKIVHVILFIFSELLEPFGLHVLKVCILYVCLCRVVHSYTVG